jgi:hypothetical protein
MEIRWLAAFGIGLFLTGGVQAWSILMPGPAGELSTMTKVDFSLPPGAPCTERYDRYQAVVEADHRTGNVNEPVYVEIERELSRAAAACAAGNEGEALSLIHQSEARHGYHP